MLAALICLPNSFTPITSSRSPHSPLSLFFIAPYLFIYFIIMAGVNHTTALSGDKQRRGAQLTPRLISARGGSSRLCLETAGFSSGCVFTWKHKSSLLPRRDESLTCTSVCQWLPATSQRTVDPTATFALFICVTFSMELNPKQTIFFWGQSDFITAGEARVMRVLVPGVGQTTLEPNVNKNTLCKLEVFVQENPSCHFFFYF